MSENTVKTPWKENLGDVPFTMEYFDGSMYEMVEEIGKKYPNYVAFDFMGRSTTYRELLKMLNNVLSHFQCWVLEKMTRLLLPCLIVHKPFICSMRLT